ncbi:dedicator of cytokinesis protein 1 [Caerostris extrusa]|uniref:Dedicator of cytokinesis protein 1 n=1 Tax=Caerostris extrusa TaxID=172846 RepID=A0AAV4XKB8_CAEEX|nr:dedicator of cytokinesis protein 1 [Caerostris extrusa]
MRRETAFEIRAMWFNLGPHQIHFVRFEHEMITKLDMLVEGGRGDEEYKDLFLEIVGGLCENHQTMHEKGMVFVRTVVRLMKRLLEYRMIVTDENKENRMSCTVNLLEFYHEINRKEMYIRYLYKLCDLHLDCENYVEAAFTLKLHAKLLRWSDESLSQLLKMISKLWETGIAICKELTIQSDQNQNTFVYLIMDEDFQHSYRTKHLFIEVKAYELLTDFTSRLLNQYPNAKVMNKLAPPGEDITESDKQRGPKDSDNEFATMWLERTNLVISYPLPGILHWFPVTSSQSFEISPLENAIETMEMTNKRICNLVLQHRSDPMLPIHPLSMLLNGVVDAAVMGGIINYEKAFFTEEYTQTHNTRKDTEGIQKLKDLIACQVPLLKAGIVIHKQKAPESLKPFHQHMEEAFLKLRTSIEEKYAIEKSVQSSISISSLQSSKISPSIRGASIL